MSKNNIDLSLIMSDYKEIIGKKVNKKNFVKLEDFVNPKLDKSPEQAEFNIKKSAALIIANKNLKVDYINLNKDMMIGYLEFEYAYVTIENIEGKTYWQIQMIDGAIDGREGNNFWDGDLLTDECKLLRCLVDVETGEYKFYPDPVEFAKIKKEEKEETEDEKTNNSDTKYELATAYYYGDGVERNYEKAYELFSELVKNNCGDVAKAKYYIGLMYKNGKYVKKDLEKAFNIFEELVSKYSDSYAACELGEMYEYGTYVEKDLEKAKEYYKTATYYSNDEFALLHLGDIYLSEGIDYYQNAEECYKRLFDVYDRSNYSEIYEKLGYLYYVWGKDDKALDYLESLEDKSSVALYLGGIYSGDEYYDFEKAIYYLEPIKDELPFAKLILAEVYLLNGEHGGKSYTKEAVELYKSLLDCESSYERNHAKFVLGSIYYEGKKYGFDIDEDKEYGYQLIKEAAEDGYETAIEALKKIDKKGENKNG